MDGLSLELTQREFNEWQEYFLVEPFGQRHNDYLVSTLIAIVANFMRGEDQPAFSPEDFIPTYSTTPADQYNHDLAVEADLAYVQSMVDAGLIIDKSKAT